MEKLQVGNHYPLAAGERVEGYDHKDCRVRYTGDQRPPKKGEWFLSGAKIEAYQALWDFTVVYPIGTLVKGKTVTRWVPDETVSDS